MNSLLSSLLRFDDNTMNDSILRLMSQYNRNQEMYNQNMEMMFSTLEYLLQHRQEQRQRRPEEQRQHEEQRRPEPNRHIPEEQVFEFTLPNNVSDILLRLLDPSGQYLSQTQLTSEQIRRATTIYNYEETETPLVCPISLESIENNDVVMKINRCGHIFKEQPLRRWLQRNHQCPVCRGSLN